MNTKELINFGRESGIKTVDIPLDSENKNGIGLNHLIYSELMTLFMNQGVNIDRAYIEVRNNNLSLTLHGSDGNMMHISLPDVISKRLHRDLPVSTDFMIEAAEDRKLIERQTAEINRAIESTTARSGRTGTTVSRNANSGIVSLDAEMGRNSYAYHSPVVTVSNLTIPDGDGYVISIGISSMSIPVIASATKGNLVLLQGINTNPSHLNEGGQPDPIRNYYCPTSDMGSEAPQIPQIPLSYHMILGARAYGYHSRMNVTDCNIISRQNASIVKEIFPNEYDSMTLRVLAKMPNGTMQKAITKIKKSVPFGRIHISLDYTEEGTPTLFCYVTNEINEDGNTTNSVDKSTDLTEHIIYCDSEEKTVATMSYSTWMDNCKTTRQGSISFANIGASISSNGEYEEFIGINDCNNLVYGVTDAYGHRYICTITTLEAALDFDIPEVIVKKTTSKRTARDILVADALVVPTELDSNSHYTKWKFHSDSWYTARNLQCPVDLNKVFTGFINSGEEVTEEDITEFGRLS
jgi:hypothetical protein